MKSENKSTRRLESEEIELQDGDGDDDDAVDYSI